MDRCRFAFGVVFTLTGCRGGGEGVVCGLGTERVDDRCVAIGSEPGSDEPDVEPTGSDAPEILSVSSNITRMTDEDTLSITAIVTDPDGIDDLIGGELLSPGGASYGAFATGAQEGAYQVTLGWSALDTVETIAFDGEIDRPFLVRFYDAAGHAADHPFVIALYCDEGTACDGACTDLSTDGDHCGSCGRACDDRFDTDGEQCQEARCIVATACDGDMSRTCDEACAYEGLGSCIQADYTPGDWTLYGSVGLTVDAQCAYYTANISYCSEPVDRQVGGSAFSCFCRE